jgi:hypothetical protein
MAPKLKAKVVPVEEVKELPVVPEGVDELPEGAVVQDCAEYIDPFDFVYEVKTVGKPIVGLDPDEVDAFVSAVLGKVDKIQISRKIRTN